MSRKWEKIFSIHGGMIERRERKLGRRASAFREICDRKDCCKSACAVFRAIFIEPYKFAP